MAFVCLNLRNSFNTISTSDPHREAVEIWAECADCEVDLKLAEHSYPRSGHQRH